MVYVLGTGSAWADNELRFSLRSLENYVDGIGQVFIVGTCPAWLTGVVYLPFPDHYTCKERNIMLKVAYACGHPDLSQTFMHVHDDHFALAHQVAGDMPNWCGGPLERLARAIKSVNPRNHWWESVNNTDKALRARGFETRNYDLHLPILLDKIAYPEIMDEYDWKGQPRGFVVKSLYANTMGVEPTVIGDIKLNQRYPLRDVVTRIKGRPWFSLGNGALSNAFKKLLQELYPHPSRFEIVP